jgi:CBS domain-containing protein
VEGGRTIGLISVDRLREVPPEQRVQQRVRDHLVPVDEDHSVAPETPLLEAIAKMGRVGAQRLLVLRPGYPELVGLLTRSGLARFVELRQALGAEGS